VVGILAFESDDLDLDLFGEFKRSVVKD